jgi:hypothetical protein
LEVFAWTATRYGTLHIRIVSVILTHEGVSIHVYIKAKSWSQRWSKDEAVDLVASHFRRGEWAPVFTMWLGDGKAKRRDALSSDYKIVIAAKEPWRLGLGIGTNKALVASGREAFKRLREVADIYGVLLDVLQPHKWIDVELATDDALRVAYRLNTEKRSINVLRETYRQNDGEVPTASYAEEPRRGAVAVAGVVMYLHLVSGGGGSLLAEHSTRDVGKALAIAGRLESAGLRPNIVKSGPNYVVYFTTADLSRLAERDETVRKAIVLYLAEKVKNGTPRQREIAERILHRHPFLNLALL